MDQRSSDNICRICLNVQDTLFSLYRKRHGTSPYEKLISRTKLNIQLNDSGPPSICSQCLIDLDTTVSFLDKCERSNQLLSATYPHDDRRIESESETKLVYETQSEEVSLVDAMEKKPSAVVFPEEKCSECGSKRRCQHWAPPAIRTCQYCQKTFNKKYNYQCHVKRHIGLSSYPCGRCGAALSSRWSAARHCGGGEGRARRVCPAPGCTRSFTTVTNLRTHLRTHTGERPFECDDCGKTFISKNILNNHMRIHTGVKPYMCQICGKQFTTNKLAAHVASHRQRGGAGGGLEGGRGRERHPCPRCPRSLPSTRALREHSRTHDVRKTHACKFCDCTYKFKQSLNYHIKNAHGVGARASERADTGPIAATNLNESTTNVNCEPVS